MGIYKKPLITSIDYAKGIFPLAGAGVALINALAALSASEAAVIGVAAGLGAGVAAAKGNNIIKSYHANALTARKYQI